MKGLDLNRLLIGILLSTALYTFLPAQAKIILIGHLPFDGGVTDVWGYVDTISEKEYAIVGTLNSIRIIDVSIPELPQLTKHMEDVPGFDFKTWKNYLYSVTGAPGNNQGVIIDIQNPSNPIIAGHFPSAHNIFISSNGYLFAEVPGLRIYDLNLDPLSPALLYDSRDDEGHDAALIGNRLYDFHGRTGTNIYDIDFGDSLKLTLRGSITDPNIAYHHSGWPTEDGHTLFICDELAVNPFPDITAWNITDPANPIKVGEFNDTNATVHNLYIFGDYAYTSYYSAGFRVLDISDPAKITTAGEYDTNPFSGNGFQGAFGAYHFYKSGFTYISDATGLYIFKFEVSVTNVEDKHRISFGLFQNYPNPFNPSTVIEYNLTEACDVKLIITSVLGEEIQSLINEYQDPGQKSVVWDGTNSNGSEAAPGVYYYTLYAGDHRITKKMILLK